MKKKKNKLPDFNKMTYEEEATWFDTHSLLDYPDEIQDIDLVFDLKKPRTETIIVRMQKKLKDKLNAVARSKGLNVSTLTRMWLIERLQSAR